MKKGSRFFRGQLAKMISNEKVEGIRSASHQAYVLCVCSHLLKRSSRFKSYFCLMMSDENDDTNMLVLQSGNVIGLHVLVIYKYVVRFHASSPFFASYIVTEHSGPTPGITRRPARLLYMTSSASAVGCMPLLGAPMTAVSRHFSPAQTN